MDTRQAEAMSRALAEALSMGDLATKADLKDLKIDLIKWMVMLLFLQAGLIVALIKLLP